MAHRRSSLACCRCSHPASQRLNAFLFNLEARCLLFWFFFFVSHPHSIVPSVNLLAYIREFTFVQFLLRSGPTSVTRFSPKKNVKMVRLLKYAGAAMLVASVSATSYPVSTEEDDCPPETETYSVSKATSKTYAATTTSSKVYPTSSTKGGVYPTSKSSSKSSSKPYSTTKVYPTTSSKVYPTSSEEDCVSYRNESSLRKCKQLTSLNSPRRARPTQF
jgi:hypothetical protein